VPKSYEDLLAPKYRGRLVLDSDDQDVLAGLADVWGEEKATSFFKSLAVNQASLRRGRTLIGQLLAAGEFSIALFLHSHVPISLKANRAPVEFVYLPPHLTKLVPIFLAKHSPHPHSAILLYDYLLSKDAQKLMVEKLDRVAVRKDVEGKHPEIAKEKYSVVNPSIEGARIRQYQKFFNEIFGGL
jgi:iron(III) transport system substrate-binding protein